MINLCAGINSTGYGVAATNILRQLFKVDSNLALFPIGSPHIESQAVAEIYQRAIANQDNFDANAPGLKIWHQFALADRYSSTYNAALTFFELDTLTPREVKHLSSLNHVFVSSKWAKDILNKRGIKNASAIPMGADPSLFFYEESKDKVYKFFSSGKIEYRKGHDLLHEIFNRAFRKDDNVELHIKWSNPFLSEKENLEWESMYKSTPLGEKIIFHKTRSQEQLAEIQRNCDCGIFPARAEGFGLGILESIACGLPVITTDYSAPVGFCNLSNAALIPPDGLEQAIDGKWFDGTGNWAHLSDKTIDEFAAVMRYNYEQDIRQDPDYKDVIEEYNWRNCAQSIINQFKKDRVY